MNNSQASVTTRVRCGGLINDEFTTNLLLSQESPQVKNMKSGQYLMNFQIRMCMASSFLLPAALRAAQYDGN